MTKNRHQWDTHHSSSTTEDTQTRDSNPVTKSKARWLKISSTNSQRPKWRHRLHWPKQQKWWRHFMTRNEQTEKGDKVWLEGPNITMTRPSKKLGEKRYGPFEVLEKEGLTAYHLQLPTTWKKIHPVFNEALLTPYKPPSYPQQQQPWPAPPVIVEGDEEYEVDEILGSQMKNSKLQYLVRWKDYPSHTDWTWEPESNIMHAPEAIKDFHTKNPSAPWWLLLDTRIITFQRIPNDNIPIHVREAPWEESLTGKTESSNNITVIGTLTLCKTGVMLWMNIFHFFTHLLP